MKQIVDWLWTVYLMKITKLLEYSTYWYILTGFWWVDQNETKMNTRQWQDLFLWKVEENEKLRDYYCANDASKQLFM